MKIFFSKGWLSVSIVFGGLIIDQVIKIIVKTSMYYHESIRITDWFYIYFVENNGMAFGMQILPKVIQTLSRILFSAIIIWYIYKLIKANYKSGYVACVSVILAGAIGNIIDSIFYGVIFSESTNHNISNLISLGNGYSSWLHGKVVDMFYFPLCEFNWPYWMPFIGGDNFVFFSPIFNFADALISCGMFVLILFYRNDFNKSFHLIKKNFKALTTDANQQ